MTSEREPAVGWRLWRLREGRLHSWAVDYVWEPGPVEARCLIVPTGLYYYPPAAVREPCERSPGEGCRCGIWALWDLSTCVTRARRVGPRHRGSTVMGLISGWGTVAIHGREGFRAQHAAILCLFADSVWDRALDHLVSGPPAGAGLVRLLSRLTSSAAREGALRRAAAHYGVPLLRLAEAVDRGVLAEFGLKRGQIETVRPRGRPD